MKQKLFSILILSILSIHATASPTASSEITPQTKPQGIPAPTNAAATYETSKQVPEAFEWKQKEIHAAVGENDGSIDFHYAGRNKMDRPVRIAYVRKTCGCQDIYLSTETVAPGEEVTIRGKITFPPSSGRLTKPFEVFTDVGGPSTLTVHIDSPETIRIDPTILHWYGTDASPKTVTITTKEPNIIDSVRVLSGGFTLTEEKSPTVWKVTLTPTGESMRNALRIKNKKTPRPSYVHLEYEGPAKPPVPGTGITGQGVTADNGQATPTTSPNLPEKREKSRDELIRDTEHARALLRLAIQKLETQP